MSPHHHRTTTTAAAALLLAAVVLCGCYPSATAAKADDEEPVVRGVLAANAAWRLADEQDMDPADIGDFEFRDEPVPLLLDDEHGHSLIIQDEGLAFLNAIGDTKLSIVVTAGPARSGKSFLLNTLLGVPHDKGFYVGHTPKGTTKGVWFWGRPRFVERNGEQLAVIHMDTEGFGAIGNFGESYDPKLCAFAAIFASSFYYNIMQVINMNNIKFLSTVALFDDVFRARFGIEFPLAPPFWIVQGFDMDLSAFDPPDAEGYLDYCYSQKSSLGEGNPDAVKYNRVIDMIQAKFPEQQPPRIMLMDHPQRTVKNSELANLSFDQFDPAYQAQILELRKIIDKRITAKQFQNFTITGTSMAKLVMRLVPAMNKLDDDAPDLIRNIASIVATECFAYYLDSLSTVDLPAAPRTITSAHEEASTTAIQEYDTKCVGNATLPENQDARERLEWNMTTNHQLRLHNNTEIAGHHCDSLYDHHMAVLRAYKDRALAADDSDDDEPELALHDAIAAADADLVSGCHINAEEKNAKLSRFRDAAADIQALYDSRMNDRFMVSFGKKSLMITAIAWAIFMLFKLLTLVKIAPEWTHTAAGYVFYSSLTCAGAIIALNFGLVEQAFAAVGVTVRREDVLTWLETVRKSWRLVMGYCGGAIQVLAAVPGVVRGSREALVATLEPNIAVDGAAQRIRVAFNVVVGTVCAVVTLGFCFTRTRRCSCTVVLVLAVALVTWTYIITGGDDEDLGFEPLPQGSMG